MQHLRKFNENRKPKGYWSYENVKEEALRFKSRNEFRKNSLGAYSIAHKNGWLDAVCSHTLQLKEMVG